MSKRALVLGLVMLAVSATGVEADWLEEQNAAMNARKVSAAEQMLCDGGEIRNLEKQQQFGVPVIVGTEYIGSEHRSVEYREYRMRFVLGLIEYGDYERSNTTVVMLTAKLFPLRGDSIFEAQDKAQLREKLIQKAGRAVLMGKGNSPESLISNEYTPLTIPCRDGGTVRINRRSQPVANFRRY